MRIEIVPDYPRDNAEPPYPTARCEIETRVGRLVVAPGTEEKVLARASQEAPEGRNFVIEANQKHYGGRFVAVQYEALHRRWFVEVSTPEELMTILDSLGGSLSVKGAVISIWDD